MTWARKLVRHLCFFTVTDQVVKLQYSKSRTATNFDDCLTLQEKK